MPFQGRWRFSQGVRVVVSRGLWKGRRAHNNWVLTLYSRSSHAELPVHANALQLRNVPSGLLRGDGFVVGIVRPGPRSALGVREVEEGSSWMSWVWCNEWTGLQVHWDQASGGKDRERALTRATGTSLRARYAILERSSLSGCDDCSWRGRRFWLSPHAIMFVVGGVMKWSEAQY